VRKEVALADAVGYDWPTHMASIPSTALDNASIFCDLLYSALKREEEKIAQITEIAAQPGRNPEWFLTSVAHATELAIQYLVRKEALRQNRAIQGEVAVPGNYNPTDMCLLDGSSHVASLELKHACRTKTKGLREDVVKVLAQSIPGVVHSERYNGWIRLLEHETDANAAEQFIQCILKGTAELGRWIGSPAIPINRALGSIEIAGIRFRFMQVVVFNPVEIP